MKKKVIKLTESQLINMIKKTVKKVLKEEDKNLDSNSSEHNYSGWDYEVNGDILSLTLYFGDEYDKREDYEIDWDIHVSGSYSAASLESPEEYPEIETIINSITQVYPIEKEIDEVEFYQYLDKLKIGKKFKDLMNDLSADRAENEADDGYEPDYDGPDDEWRG